MAFLEGRLPRLDSFMTYLWNKRAYAFGRALFDVSRRSR